VRFHEREFAQVQKLLVATFAGQGATITPMQDADHYLHLASFLNPSYAEALKLDPMDSFDPNLSIQENCWHSEAAAQSEVGFWMDGFYHSVLILIRWPKSTFPGIIHRPTNLRLLDYAVTVNVKPLPVSSEITKEEQAHERIAGDFASEGKLLLKTALRKKERKIEALSQGHTLPFKVLFSVRVWELEGLELNRAKRFLPGRSTTVDDILDLFTMQTSEENTVH
jgi:hypothetical protein